MDLRDFIKETLVQIAGGVSDAQSELSDTNAVVSPTISPSYVSNGRSQMLPTLSGEVNSATVVSFDVALTATEESGTKGGIGVVAGIVSLGSTGQSSNENTSVSRVKFDVPVTLPNGS